MKIKLTIIELFAAMTIIAQDPKGEGKKDWDVNNPPGEGWNWKEVKFTTNEGAWMNLDVSPDGKPLICKYSIIR